METENQTNQPAEPRQAQAEALADLPVDSAQAAAIKGGEGSNANIQNFPHQLSLRNNHNEAIAVDADDAATAAEPLADLPLKDEQAAQVIRAGSISGRIASVVVDPSDRY